MRILRALLGVLVLLVAIGVVGGFLLPDTVHIERSVRVERTPAQVYALIDGHRRFNEWSPWADLDPATQYSYSGPDRGVGASMTWVGDPDTVGSGSQTIVAVEHDRRVDTDLQFGDQKAKSTMLLVPDGDATQVTWSFDSSFDGHLIGRWFGLAMDRMLGPDYEKGLARLKSLAESEPMTAAR